MEDDTKRKYITWTIVFYFDFIVSVQIYYLRCHVSWSTTSYVNKLFFPNEFCKSKVNNDWFDIVFSLTSDHNVLKFEISMHDILGMEKP